MILDMNRKDSLSTRLFAQLTDTAPFFIQKSDIIWLGDCFKKRLVSLLIMSDFVSHKILYYPLVVRRHLQSHIVR